uniref:Cell division and transport-associated protein TolA n=1 Tax=Candidatus Kentrum eta TaxID=2126337 RepID=A0A450V489_9GAMM|nr:MAG: Cell division and transport-associated protein TolA [Candidatus Kentron sp. H]VFJ92975.1 MAG: Cell division and transport-associated protein TolA [Candidatus Kentron sp. H]VFJ99588.1 MAG: Cell division and transport-associated protein TolA [Candidatus Kentron sp. H]
MKSRSFTGKAKPLFLAIAVHAVFIGVLLLSFDWSSKFAPPSATPKQQKAEPILAMVVDEIKVQAELAEIDERKQIEQEAERARMKALEDQAKTVRKRREKEEQKLADIQRQLKEQEELQRKQAAKREAERKRQEKAEKERQRKAKEAEAKKRKKAAERKRREAEQALQRKLAAEQAKRDRERQRLLDQYRREYITGIKSAVERNWIRPPGAAKGLQCKLKVTQTSGGEVMNVSITVSSGNAAFDRSAVAAVFKASPLPKPKDPEVFDRNIVLTLLNPEN